MKKQLLILGTFLALAPRSDAAVITTNPSAPSEKILKSYSDDSGSKLNWNATAASGSSWRDAGQMFLATDDVSLEAITFRITSVSAGAFGASVTIKVFETGDTITALQNGTLRSTEGGTLPDASGLAADDYITFTLDTPVALTQGKYYTVMLHFDSVAANRQIGLSSGANQGAAANYWTSQTPFSSYAKGSNLTLTTYFQGTVVPEPSSVAALVCGGLVALALHGTRRRKRSPMA